MQTQLVEPLCVAALNTPAADASAQVFANVLRAAFAGEAQASDFVLNAVDLSVEPKSISSVIGASSAGSWRRAASA